MRGLNGGKEGVTGMKENSNSKYIEQKLRNPTVICDLAEPFIFAFSDGAMSRAESGREG